MEPTENKTEVKNGVEIKQCPHCAGLGECSRSKTGGVKHSCKYCIKKTGLDLSSEIFPHVPCGYCGGKGFNSIDLRPQKPQFKKPFNRQFGNRQRRQNGR